MNTVEMAKQAILNLLADSHAHRSSELANAVHRRVESEEPWIPLEYRPIGDTLDATVQLMDSGIIETVPGASDLLRLVRNDS